MNKIKKQKEIILNLCLIGLTVLFSAQISLGQEFDWLKEMKSLVLLTSTRADARQILGKPIEDKESYLEYFDLEEGRISVLYASGKCVKTIVNNKETLTGWKVPEWTIIEINIDLKDAIKPKVLKVKFTDFEKYISGYPDEVSYSNKDLGINYNLYKGKIRYISYTPPKEFENLLCRATKEEM